MHLTATHLWHYIMVKWCSVCETLESFITKKQAGTRTADQSPYAAAAAAAAAGSVTAELHNNLWGL